MNIFRKPIDQIDSQDIENLIVNQVSESLTLDYKEELHKKTASEDFYADYTAFANNVGGLIIYGMEEAREDKGNKLGYPSKITGINGDDVAGFIQQVEQALQSGVRPPIVGIRFQQVECVEGVILVVQIPKSFNAPHQVTFHKKFRFFKRSESGNYKMEVDELRDTFLANENSETEHIKFIEKRLESLANPEAVPFKPTPKQACLYLIPIGKRQITIDPRKAKHVLDTISCENVVRGNSAFAYSGFIRWDNRGKNRKTIQIFRNGVIEQTADLWFEYKDRFGSEQKPLELLVGSFLEDWIMKATSSARNIMENLEIYPPFRLCLSMTGIKGSYIYTGPQYQPYIDSDDVENKHFIDNQMILSWPVVIDSSQSNHEILEPLFDHIWQSAGMEQSPFVAKERADREKKEKELQEKADKESE